MRFLNRNFFWCVLGSMWMAGFSETGRATIYYDLEEDPIPYVTMNVVIPRGAWAETQKDHASGALLARIWDVGTRSLVNSEFLGRLADYGASYSLSLGPQSTSWSLSFPVDSEMDRLPLVEILKENWNYPRINDTELNLAKGLLNSTFKGLLDRDFALTGSFLRRWVTQKLYNGFPTRVNEIQSISLEQVHSVHKKIIEQRDVWVGVVGPESSRPLTQMIAESVFSKQGELEEKELKESLVSSEIALKKNEYFKKPRAFLIDRKDLAQSTVEFLVLPDFQPEGKQELNYYFGNYIFLGSGFGSFFTDELRTKNGVSYSVGQSQSDFYGRKNFSVAFNPTKPKTELGISTLAALLARSFQDNHNIESMTDEEWKKQFQSFKYGYVLDRSNALGRLGERKAVVLGEVSPSFKASKFERWSVQKDAVFNLFSNMWKQSFKAIVVLGNASEVKPWIERDFPGYEIEVIPYRESLDFSAR